MIHLSFIKPEPIFSKPSPPKESMVWNKDLKLEQGKNYLVKAPSGGGKSTLVHIIFGLRKDYEGKVVISDKDISSGSSETIAKIRKEQLSMVFQDLKLIPELTAWDNIEMTRSLSNFKSKIDIKDMAKALGVSEFLEQSTATLSYGQRQRIAIIRALCRPFSFLLLDEPFSHLDDDNIRVACELIKTSLAEQKAGLLLVSHESPYYFDINETLIL